jgi:hypothetical protein
MNFAINYGEPRTQFFAMARKQRAHVEALLGNVAVRVVSWAFEQPNVQHAFVKHVTCSTPIGQALNEQIRDVSEATGSTVLKTLEGLERFVESSIEDFMRNNDCDVRADNIKDLDEAVETIIQDSSTIVNGLCDAVMEKIAEKLSR